MKYMNWEFIFGELCGTFSIVSLIVADLNFMVRGEPLSIKLTCPPPPPQLVCIFLDVCEELWRLLLGLPWPFIYFCFVVGLSVGGIDEHLRGEEGRGLG